MGRIFFVVGMPCYGECGGGHGIEYRLFKANEKEHLLNDAFFIFADCVIQSGDNNTIIPNNTKYTRMRLLKKTLSKYIPDFVRVMRISKNYKRTKEYVERLNSGFKFSADDIYIFQDVKMAYIFIKCFDIKRCALIYHMQGSMYYEWKANKGIESLEVKKYFDNIFRFVCERVNYICFPSEGTKECLIDTEKSFISLFDENKVKIIYNGLSCSIDEAQVESKWVPELNSKERFVFATIAVLNEAKAVERIPQYLSRLQEKGIDFVWILVGNGLKSKDVGEQIYQNGISDRTIWIKDYITHDSVLKILSKSDFYILFHKQSVFDLSILEAMHYGCIPILTKVGGNKELIRNDNGLFVDDFSDADSLVGLIKSGNLEDYKEKNRDLQKNQFSETVMLERYHRLCLELDKVGK